MARESRPTKQERMTRIRAARKAFNAAQAAWNALMDTAYTPAEFEAAETTLNVAGDELRRAKAVVARD